MPPVGVRQCLTSRRRVCRDGTGAMYTALAQSDHDGDVRRCRAGRRHRPVGRPLRLTPSAYRDGPGLGQYTLAKDEVGALSCTLRVDGTEAASYEVQGPALDQNAWIRSAVPTGSCDLSRQ